MKDSLAMRIGQAIVDQYSQYEVSETPKDHFGEDVDFIKVFAEGVAVENETAEEEMTWKRCLKAGSGMFDYGIFILKIISGVCLK